MLFFYSVQCCNVIRFVQLNSLIKAIQYNTVHELQFD